MPVDDTPILPIQTSEATPLAELALPDALAELPAPAAVADATVVAASPRWTGKYRCGACGAEARVPVVEGGLPLDPLARLSCPMLCPVGVYHLMGYQLEG